MQVLQPDAAGIQEAINVLQQGGIVAHATETCYGLACDLGNQKAVEKLFALKQRSFDKPVSGLFESIEASKEFVSWNEAAEAFGNEHLPGPYTLVLPLQSDALHPTPNGGNTIGVRVSSHPIAQELIKAFGKPISTTSANVADRPSAYSAEEIIQQFGKENPLLDIVLDCGTLEKRSSSTVLDFVATSGDVLRP